MNEAMVRFPVKCPECGIECGGSFRVTDVAAALTANRPIRLHAICHDRSWDASTVEQHQIRDYLGPVWLYQHGGAL